MAKPNPPAAEKSKFVPKRRFQTTFNLFSKPVFINLFISTGLHLIFATICQNAFSIKLEMVNLRQGLRPGEFHLTPNWAESMVPCYERCNAKIRCAAADHRHHLGICLCRPAGGHGLCG